MRNAARDKILRESWNSLGRALGIELMTSSSFNNHSSSNSNLSNRACPRSRFSSCGRMTLGELFRQRLFNMLPGEMLSMLVLASKLLASNRSTLTLMTTDRTLRLMFEAYRWNNVLTHVSWRLRTLL
jgi:hypothetical protein